jgi:hypothetical protein
VSEGENTPDGLAVYLACDAACQGALEQRGAGAMNLATAKLDSAQHALAECKTVMEAKHIADTAEVARFYLARIKARIETVNRAAEIRLLAGRSMGEFLAPMPKATGTRTVGGRGFSGGSVNGTPGEQPATLATS